MKFEVKESHYAVYHQSKYGPTFGIGFDLKVSSLSNRTNRGRYMRLESYKFPNGICDEEAGKLILGGSDCYFQAVEIEVFQLE